MKISSLKFLTDENISPRIVSFLRKKGIDVVDVKEKGWHGNEDKYLMEIANKGKRFILTHDTDFGTLAINEGVPCYGIIYMSMLMYLTKVSICRTIASWHDQDFREHYGSFGGNSLLMLPAWSTWRKADGRRDSSARNVGAKSIG